MKDNYVDMRNKTYKLLKNLNQPACIVLGVESFTGLSIVRSLGIMGIPVIGVDRTWLAIGAFSKYCSISEICCTDEELLSFLQEASTISRYKNVIICESDIYLLFLDKYKLDLKQNFALTIPLEISLSKLMNKENMIKLAIDANVDTPRTFFSYEVSLQEIKKEVIYPCFIKPLYSQTYLDTKGGIANGEKELGKILHRERFKSGYIVQEIIPGPETNIWGYAGYTGKNLRVGVTYYKYRQSPKDFGVGVVAFSMENKDVKEAGNKFLNHLNYSGLFSLEFKKDLRDGRYKLLEINPRICGQNELFTFLGFNLAYIAYRGALNLKFVYPVEQKDGILWISDIDDFITCLRHYFRSDKLVFVDWIRKSFKADCRADFRLTDIKPFIIKITYHLMKLIHKLDYKKR